MNYTLQMFNTDELEELLLLFSETVLCDPISKKQKDFKKYMNGFRANKLPRYILDKIYCKEIHAAEGSFLEKFIIENLKLNFKNTRIEELVDSVTEEDATNVAAELEKEIIHVGLTISPKQVFILAGYTINKSNNHNIDAYHQLVMDEIQRVRDECTANLISKYEEKYINFNADYEQSKTSLTIERNTIKNLKELGKQKDAILGVRETENSLLKEKLLKLTSECDFLKNKFHDYTAKVTQINKLQNEIIELKNQIEELGTEISRLESCALSPETVRELSLEVIEDLKSNNITEKNFISEAINMFAVQETLNESWNKLSNLEEERLNIIIKKMEADSICNNDIDKLDAVEDYVHYKYMIIKGLKVIFYRYLEQKSGKRTIDQKFKESYNLLQVEETEEIIDENTFSGARV